MANIAVSFYYLYGLRDYNKALRYCKWIFIGYFRKFKFTNAGFMYFLFLFLSLALGYLSGSISFAVLISKWVKGIDIRAVGNKNPGTANVAREVGIGWAALVLIGDLAKGVLPLVLASLFLFPDDHYTDYFALFLTGMSVITGHC